MNEVHFDLADPDAVHFCPECGAGYTAKVQRCVDCGKDLVPRSWIEAQEVENQRNRLESSEEPTVALCRLNNRLLANLLEGELDVAGVSFFVREMGVQPGLRMQSLSGIFEFVVIEKDLEKARGILLQLEEDTREEQEWHEE